MARKTPIEKPAAPVEEAVDLRGKTGPQIAEMVNEGEISQEFAEDFVAERAVRKLRKAIAA